MLLYYMNLECFIYILVIFTAASHFHLTFNWYCILIIKNSGVGSRCSSTTFIILLNSLLTGNQQFKFTFVTKCK